MINCPVGSFCTIFLACSCRSRNYRDRWKVGFGRLYRNMKERKRRKCSRPRYGGRRPTKPQFLPAPYRFFVFYTTAAQKLWVTFLQTAPWFRGALLVTLGWVRTYTVFLRHMIDRFGGKKAEKEKRPANAGILEAVVISRELWGIIERETLCRIVRSPPRPIFLRTSLACFSLISIGQCFLNSTLLQQWTRLSIKKGDPK